MGKDIFGLRFLSLATLCGLFWSAQGQDCKSNLGSTSFKPKPEALSWQYCSVADVSSEGPSDVKIKSVLSAPTDLEDFTSKKMSVSAVATNPFKLNAVAADPDLKPGKDYDPDELYFADLPENMLVTKFTGTSDLFNIEIPSVKVGSEFAVEYTLCNVVNPNSPDFQASIPDYMMQNPGWESSVKIEGIKVGTNYIANNSSCQDGVDYFGKGNAMTVADEGCKTYTFKGKATTENFTFHIYSYYPNTPIPIGIKEVKVTGCFDPKIRTADLNPCKGEQIPLMLNRNYNASTYKWERRIGSGPWTTISSTVTAFDETNVSDPDGTEYQYRCIVDGQESNVLSVTPKTCCVVNGKPASQKKVFSEDFGYFSDYYTYVDKDGNVSKQNFAFRANTLFTIPDHDFDDGSGTIGPVSGINRDGSVSDGTYAVVVPSNGGITTKAVYDPNGGLAKHFSGVTTDFTSLTTGQDNSACLFINVRNQFKGVIFENTIHGLCTGKNLTFECAIANMSGAVPPEVTISLLNTSGDLIATEKKTAAAGWEKVSIKDILLTDDADVIIRIEATGGSWSGGNDLAIDDIKFLTCAPPQISAYYDESTLQLDTTVCSDADLEVVMPETELLKNFFSGKQHYVLQYSIDKKVWKHLRLSSSNTINFNSDEVTKDFTDPEKVYMRVIVASESTANLFVSNPNMASEDDACADYSISDPFTITIDCPTCTASEDVEIISSEKAVVENKKKTIHLCKGESVTLNSNDVTSTTEKGDPYSNFLMTWSLDGVAKTPTPGAVADELVISWEDATEKGLSVKLTSEDADYPGQTGCMKEAEIIIIADPVPDAAFSDSSIKFCEGEGSGLVDMRLSKGDLSNYTVRWWGNSDTLTSSLGEDKSETFFENLKSDEGGVFYYQLVDNKTGCKGDLHEYEVIVNPIPDAPNDEKIQYTINGNSNETMTTDKFSQTIDKTMDLVWFQSKTEPNSQGKKSVQIDRSVATTTPYVFYIAYKDPNGGCYSERAEVVVEVLAAPTPSVKDIDLCKDGTYDPMEGIVATDEPAYELIWFESPTDTAGKALPSAPTGVVDVTKPGKYTLYVAQRATTAPYAQSEVVSFDVTVYDVKEPVDASRHEYCANETAEELKADFVKDEKNYYYADEIVFVSGVDEQPTFIPDTKKSTTQKYEYKAYQKFTTPKSNRECKGPSIDIQVDVIAVEKPKVNHSVSYVKSEAASSKEFMDILDKSPDAIEIVADQTLLWSKDETGVYVKGSTSSSKPYYDELVPVGQVEKQERWVKWEATTAAGLTCQSEPEKIDITISSTPAPIVKKIEICEEVFKGGSIPSDKEPANNADVNDNDKKLPDYEKYELVWFYNQEDADESMTNTSKLSLGSKTAPTLSDAFSGVDMDDKTVSEWTKSLYVVQTYDAGAGNVTTSPASEMKLVVNATPKLTEKAHVPVCKGPVNLTDNEYWNVSNGVKVEAEYSYEGSSVTQNASGLTKAGKYTIVGTSSLGCKSEELDLQLDIRNLSIEMDPRSETCPGDNVEQEVRIEFSYNKEGKEAADKKVNLSWESEEKTSDNPTPAGKINGPDETSFIYTSGNFEGKAGDTHTITVTMTDGYCMATTKQTVEIGNGPAGGTFTWVETDNESTENGSKIPLTDSNKDNIEINACGGPVTVDFGNVTMDKGSKVEWFKTSDYSSGPYKTDVAPTFSYNDYGTYYVRYTNHCYAYAKVTIKDASVKINTMTDDPKAICENGEYKREIDVVGPAGMTRQWYKDGDFYANNSDGLSFSPLKKKDQGSYKVEYRYDGCRAELDVVDLKVKEYVKVDMDNYEMYDGKKSYIITAGENASAPFKFSVPSDASDIAALTPTKTEKTSRNEGSLSSGNTSFDVTAVDEDHSVSVIFESDKYCADTIEFQVLRDAKLVLEANLETKMCLNEEKTFTIDTIGTGAFRRPGAKLEITATPENGTATQEKGFNVVLDTLKKNVSPRVTTTYDVTFTYQGQKLDTSITVVVYNFKVEPVNEVICSGEEISLKATVTPEDSKIEWFDDDKTTSLGEGDGIMVSPVFDGPVSAQKSQHKYWARPYSDDVTCTSSGMTPLFVDVYRPLEGDIKDTTICEGENVRIDAGSYGANLYIWVINGDSIKGSRYYQDTPAETTTYHVYMKRGDVCEAEDNATVTVTTKPVIASIDSVSYRDVDIVMDPSFGTPAFRYSIDGGEWTENTRLTGLKYTVHTITVEDANGCVLNDTFVVNDPALEFPIWFSPNVDGEFDYWTVPGIQETYPEAEFTIYDRWGKKLVEFKGEDDGWDGTYNGVLMPSTDYWYECVVREIDKVYKGHFTLIRR